MEIKVTNYSYPSLTSRHTKFYPCSCEECQKPQVFTVYFEYRGSRCDIDIVSFKVFDKSLIEVSDNLTVKDYEKLMVELQDWVACKQYWDSGPQEGFYEIL